VVGASFCATDGHASNAKTVDAYAAAATRQGATILSGVEALELVTDGDRVTGVKTTDGPYSANVVIVAAGIYTPKLIASLGLKLPLQVVLCPVAETVPTDAIRLTPVLGVAEGNFAARQTAEGGIRFIGASMPWNEGHHTATNTGMTVKEMDDMTRNALAILPGLADIRVGRVWGGLIDRTPDVMPVYDAVSQHPGLVIGAGFSGHGFGIGPMSGEILANLAINGEDTRFDLQPFRLSRFAEQQTESESLEMLG